MGSGRRSAARARHPAATTVPPAKEPLPWEVEEPVTQTVAKEPKQPELDRIPSDLRPVPARSLPRQQLLAAPKPPAIRAATASAKGNGTGDRRSSAPIRGSNATPKAMERAKTNPACELGVLHAFGRATCTPPIACSSSKGLGNGACGYRCAAFAWSASTDRFGSPPGPSGWCPIPTRRWPTSRPWLARQRRIPAGDRSLERPPLPAIPGQPFPQLVACSGMRDRHRKDRLDA